MISGVSETTQQTVGEANILCLKLGNCEMMYAQDTECSKSKSQVLYLTSLVVVWITFLETYLHFPETKL